MSTPHQRLYGSDQFVPLVILLPAGQGITRAPATSGDELAASTLLPDGPQQAVEQRSPGELIAEQGGRRVPDNRATTTQDNSPTSSCQPRCPSPLPFPQQVEQKGKVSASTGRRESYEGQAVAMQDNDNMELVSYRQEWDYVPQDVSALVNNTPLLRLYYDIWYRSSSGDTPDVHAVIHQFDARPLEELVTVIDAVCTHVPITRGRASLEDVIGWLHRGLVMCEGIIHSFAKVLIVRLRRRIACIYFRQGMLKEARREINEVEGIICCMLKDCVDVGIADAYWLSAWITLFDVWDNESQFVQSLPTINRNATKALEIARQLPDEELRKAYCGRIACSFACLKLVIASRSHSQEERAVLEREASDLVDNTAQCTLAKGDRSLWCRAKLWLISLMHGDPSERIPDELLRIISECRGVDTSNNVFTKLSVFKHDIERRFH